MQLSSAEILSLGKIEYYQGGSRELEKPRLAVLDASNKSALDHKLEHSASMDIMENHNKSKTETAPFLHIPIS